MPVERDPLRDRPRDLDADRQLLRRGFSSRATVSSSSATGVAAPTVDAAPNSAFPSLAAAASCCAAAPWYDLGGAL